jgi:hypothetical protein
MKRSANISIPVAMPNQNPRNLFPAWRLPKGMINASDEELEESIESCERWEWFGGGLVVVGVIATVAIAVIHPQYDSFLEQWGSAIADSLVAVGVVIEIKLGQMAGLRQNELKRRSDIIVGAANVRAAEANQKAEEAALELAKFRAPRTFDQEQAERIVEKLAPFAGTPFEIAVDPVVEPFFASQIAKILEVAGWEFHSSHRMLRGRAGEIGFVFCTEGISIRFVRSKMDAFMDASNALMSALANELGGSVSSGLATDENAPADTIQIEIGRKP